MVPWQLSAHGGVLPCVFVLVASNGTLTQPEKLEKKALEGEATWSF